MAGEMRTAIGSLDSGSGETCNKAVYQSAHLLIIPGLNRGRRKLYRPASSLILEYGTHSEYRDRCNEDSIYPRQLFCYYCFSLER
jgi:hypothetical protein